MRPLTSTRALWALAPLLLAAFPAFASSSVGRPLEPIGIDAAGTPLLCGTALHQAPVSDALTAGSFQHGWETIPGVIRTDGVDSFRVEVQVHESVTTVGMEMITPLLLPPEAPPLALRDDGQGEDRVAGDRIFTAGPFRSNIAIPPPFHFHDDPESPEGLYSRSVGRVLMEHDDGTSSKFLIDPTIGFLSSEIPAAESFALTEDVVVTPHLINIRTDQGLTQKTLRGRGGLLDLGSRIYQAVPDAFDFLMLFSTYRLESRGRTDPVNHFAGIHAQVRTVSTGTGLPPRDDGMAFGSRRRLLGINALDTYDRGITAKTATHEILHQWGAYLSSPGGVTDGAHYSHLSSVGSLLGGFAWIAHGDGTFERDCLTGRNQASRAAPLDLYLMGLIDGTEVPDLRLDLSDGVTCLEGSPPITDFSTVRLEELQALHGARQPGPEGAQRDFRLGFVAESRDRLLNSTELTFYDRLAAHYVAELPPEAPDPRVAFNNWSSISRFFGHGTRWTNEIPGVGRPGGPSACIADDTTLCLLDGRFRVELKFETADESEGTGKAVPLTDDSGFFWFFQPSNLEVVVKMLDACGNPSFESFWAFHTGLTNVGVTLTVTDTETWEVKRYENPRGQPLAPVLDTRAFETCDASP